MNQLNIPFKLGMQYDTWEFDLELAHDRLQGCDSYIYIGKKFNKFLNYHKYKTELIFNLDTLEAILISFDNSNSDYNELSEIVNLKLNCFSENLDYEEIKICRFVTKTNEVWVIKNNSKLYLLVSNSRYSKNIINTLLW
ncbi:MAG TPA: hypothetical protein PLL09_11660 [Flavobacterium sp.]|uniref:hypothetical protein n=1 Tax=unclassified Flavobacterium TaxID=196869 RepID=UPI0025BB8962|nr:MULTISPECIES: hypothetical protein [unclassified Flavobacterium]HRE78466.1 hypothetical protein [Flavobacterium sp.]